jgi:hypothetical protein
MTASVVVPRIVARGAGLPRAIPLVSRIWHTRLLGVQVFLGVQVPSPLL